MLTPRARTQKDQLQENTVQFGEVLGMMLRGVFMPLTATGTNLRTGTATTAVSVACANLICSCVLCLAPQCSEKGRAKGKFTP